MKLLFLFGTRPEAIKMAPLIKEFSKDSKFEVRVGLTAQHRELLDQVMHFFGITAHYDLNVMKPNQTLHGLTSVLIQDITEKILLQEKFDYVFVQGDTTTVLAGSLAAFYQKIPVIHIEAGLRSKDKFSPFPEEINRVLTSHIAAMHFCPTETAKGFLEIEGISKNVFVVGNTVIDALLNGLNIIKNTSEEVYFKKFEKVDFSKKIILVTSHRRENFGHPLDEILEAVYIVAEKFFNEIEIIFPVHPNPNVKEVVSKKLIAPNIILYNPLDYPELIWVMDKSYFIMTDSGGIQEEAPSLGKPVLVLREVTERMEGVDAGTAVLVGYSKEKIIFEAEKLLNDSSYYNRIANSVNPYGDGNTAGRVKQILEKVIN
jgi:UDP-N-acetylglucosamine 2-epimerase (non-hydrolysing)